MIELKDIHLKHRIPPNLLKDQKIEHLSESLSTGMKEMFIWSYRLNYAASLHTLPDEVLDHLLWEKHIGVSEGLRLVGDRQEKINLIESGIELHRKKGTPYAIEKALEMVSLDGEVQEWFEYDGEPYCFTVELSVHNKLSQLDDIHELILEYKNKRSWFEGFVIGMIRDDEDNFYLIDDTYDYPVFYRLTGKLWGVKEFTQVDARELKAIDDTYHYEVRYPMAKKGFVQAVAGMSVAIDDTYDYAQVYRRCGEMTTLQKEVETIESGASLTSASYHYAQPFRMCGKFSVEG